MPAFPKNTIAGARGRVAAHQRKPLVSETRGLRWWAATEHHLIKLIHEGQAFTVKNVLQYKEWQGGEYVQVNWEGFPPSHTTIEPLDGLELSGALKSRLHVLKATYVNRLKQLSLIHI